MKKKRSSKKKKIISKNYNLIFNDYLFDDDDEKPTPPPPPILPPPILPPPILPPTTPIPTPPTPPPILPPTPTTPTTPSTSTMKILPFDVTVYLDLEKEKERQSNKIKENVRNSIKLLHLPVDDFIQNIQNIRNLTNKVSNSMKILPVNIEDYVQKERIRTLVSMISKSMKILPLNIENYINSDLSRILKLNEMFKEMINTEEENRTIDKYELLKIKFEELIIYYEKINKAQSTIDEYIFFKSKIEELINKKIKDEEEKNSTNKETLKKSTILLLYMDQYLDIEVSIKNLNNLLYDMFIETNISKRSWVVDGFPSSMNENKAFLYLKEKLKLYDSYIRSLFGKSTNLHYVNDIFDYIDKQIETKDKDEPLRKIYENSSKHIIHNDEIFAVGLDNTQKKIVLQRLEQFSILLIEEMNIPILMGEI